MTTAKQWITLQNGLASLHLQDAEVPDIANDEDVLVRIKAVSLNYRDVEVCEGDYGHHASLEQSKELVPCSDMCGIIEKVGPKASQFWKVGDRVLSTFCQSHVTGQVRESDMKSGLGFPLPGVLQTYRIFPLHGLVKATEHLSDEEASTLPIAATTAWMSINGMRQMGNPGGKGETVLLQGTGGVSVAALQIAAASGATTIVTSSSDDKLKRAKELGATHTINYRTTPEWQEEVNKLTNQKGADIILEVGGAKTLRKSFDCITFGGIIACIGYLSGKEDEPSDELNTNVLALRRNVTLRGILNGPRDRMEEMCQFYSKNKIVPVVDKVFAFDEANKAFDYIKSGSHFGKAVIKL